jgi:glycosyltransferase involved in cell wall biosynthesis
MTRTVSIVVPCRNEAGFIDAFLDSALAQRLPPGWRLQVLVADGCSDDGTAERLSARAAAEPRLLVIANPGRIVSTGLNRAIAAATGEVIVRMDVHTTYAEDYVAECLAALERTGATCVGGAWRPVAGPGVSGYIARAFESRFGSGGAASRRTDLEGEVDTVYLGAWRRDELLRLGGFDETLVRNQDDELALRIVRGGGRVWQSARIRSHYTPRGSYRALFRQFWQYGYWKVAVIRKHRLPAAPRQLVPFGFVAALATLALAGAAWRPAWTALAALSGVYALAALAAAAAVARPWREPAAWLGIAAATTTMHFGYGLGFARGLWDFAILRRGAVAAATRLTR